MINSEPHFDNPTSYLEEFGKSSLERHLDTLDRLIDEEKRNLPVLVVGAGDGIGAAAAHHLLCSEAFVIASPGYGKTAMLNRPKTINLEEYEKLQKDNFEMRYGIDTAALNQELLLGKSKYDDEAEMVAKIKTEENFYRPTKCRIKDTTKSLAKRRAKNKKARKTRQKNRK